MKKQLERLKQNKAAGADGVSPRALKICTDQLCGSLQPLFNLSLSWEKIPVLWKTCCLVPIPPKNLIQSSLNDYRPVTLMSHTMNVQERLLLAQ